MFRATRRVLAAAQAVNKAATTHRTKLSTGITGLAVHPDPLHALRTTYHSTLKVLGQVPASAVYRQSAEAITRERLAVVEQAGEGNTEEQIEQVERKLEAGIAEELIQQAEDELKLASKMLEYKPCVCVVDLVLRLASLTFSDAQVGGTRGGASTRTVGAVPNHPFDHDCRRPAPQVDEARGGSRRTRACEAGTGSNGTRSALSRRGRRRTGARLARRLVNTRGRSRRTLSALAFRFVVVSQAAAQTLTVSEELYDRANSDLGEKKV